MLDSGSDSIICQELVNIQAVVLACLVTTAMSVAQSLRSDGQSRGVSITHWQLQFELVPIPGMTVHAHQYSVLSLHQSCRSREPGGTV